MPMPIIYSIVATVLNIFTTHMLLTRKKTIPFCVAAFIINKIIVDGGIYLVYKFIQIPILITLFSYIFGFMYLFYIIIVFEESLAKKLFTMFSIWSLSNCLLILLFSLRNIFLGGVEFTGTPTDVLILKLVLTALLLPVLHYCFRKTYKRILSIVSDKTIYLMSLYPIVAFVFQVDTFFLIPMHFRNYYSVYNDILLILFMTLGYILVFAGISASSKKIAIEYSYKTIENQVELQRQNYKALNESLQQLYTLRHDVRHHVSAIETLVKQQKYNEALEYIEQFNKNELSKTISSLCSNFAADSIAKYNMSLALSKNIDFKAELNIPEDIGINSLDLCIVLGNCLENAIEACDKIDDGTRKYIELRSEIVDSHIVFRITNSFNGKLLKTEDKIKSTKNSDNELHGIGLSNVRETVRRYNSDIDIKYTSDQFEVTIIMCTYSVKTL